MASPWALGNLSWRELAKRVWKEIQEDEVFGRAAELSYYFLLALFPFLIFLTSVIGLVLGSGTGTRDALFDYLARVMPPSAFQLISSTMLEVSSVSGGGKLSFGILAALWAASNGLGGITTSLNTAYDIKESRPWWKHRLTAIGLTIALSVLIISALVLVVAGGHIAEWLAGVYGLGSTLPMAWKIIQWPVVLACMTLAFALIYTSHRTYANRRGSGSLQARRSESCCGCWSRLRFAFTCTSSTPTAQRTVRWAL